MMRESSTLTESKKSRISSYLSIFNWISFLTVSLSVSRMSSRFIFNRPRFIFLFSSGVYMWGDSNGFSLSYYLVGYPESSNILLQRRAGIITYKRMDFFRLNINRLAYTTTVPNTTSLLHAVTKKKSTATAWHSPHHHRS